MTKKLPYITAVLTSLLMQTNAQALALSEVKLNSSLNQTLNATIELRSATSAELDNLNVYISKTNRDTTNQGKWPQLKVDLVRMEKGNSYLTITSKDNVREPVIDFLLELIWTSGRIQREYTLLLNPAH